jgi:hypothetical protein
MWFAQILSQGHIVAKSCGGLFADSTHILLPLMSGQLNQILQQIKGFSIHMNQLQGQCEISQMNCMLWQWHMLLYD